MLIIFLSELVRGDVFLFFKRVSVKIVGRDKYREIKSVESVLQATLPLKSNKEYK